MSLDTDPNLTIREWPVPLVEVKNSLDDANWSAVPHLYCDKLSLHVNAYDEAMLSYEIGDVMQIGTAAFANYVPLAMLGKYIRITIPQEPPFSDLVWVGVVVSTANESTAVRTEGAAKKLTGKTQILRVVGLEYFLDRRQIDSAVIAGSQTTTILRPLPFNAGKGVSLDADTSRRGNRNPTTGVGSYEFAEQGTTPALWTTAQVVNYLLNYFSAADSAGAPSPTEFILDATDQLDGVLDGISPTLDPEGLTVFQCLNKLLSPQRGFVWWSEFDEPFPGSHRVRIRVETLATSLITLPSLGILPANRDQQTLDLEQQRDVADLVTAEHGSRIYHQIISRGARMTSTVTFGVGELIEDWTSGIETEYDTAVSGTAEENDAFRRAERFYRVYAAYRLDPDWDGKSGDGGAGARNWSFPALSDTGSIIASLPFHTGGLRILNHTRLKRGWDYEDTASIEETTPTGTEAEYMPAFAILHVADAASGTNDKFQFADKMGTVSYEGNAVPVSSNIKTSYHLHIQQTNPGVVLRPSNGINHALALTHFSATTEHDPEVDYDTVRITCTLEADSYAEHRWPADIDLPSDIPLQRLLLYVGDEYRLDFLAANTVVDLENGEPVLTNGGVLRDDRRNLRDIARVAYEWYRTQRYPITLTIRNIINTFRLGMLIGTIGSGETQQTANTVVSLIDFDFNTGNTMIKTNEQDLDIIQVT
jgi:hypothetical protein